MLWFLVAFGGTGCRVSVNRILPFVPQGQTLSAGDTNL